MKTRAFFFFFLVRFSGDGEAQVGGVENFPPPELKLPFLSPRSFLYPARGLKAPTRGSPDKP